MIALICTVTELMSTISAGGAKKSYSLPKFFTSYHLNAELEAIEKGDNTLGRPDDLTIYFGIGGLCLKSVITIFYIASKAGSQDGINNQRTAIRIVVAFTTHQSGCAEPID